MPNPRLRRRAREQALRFLFGLDFTGAPWQEALEIYWAMQPARPGVKRYATKVIRGVRENLAELDREITGALQHWAPGRVGRVEWALLRIALYEMRHGEDVPPAVAINEAIELAKRYGTEETPRFINGLLDRLARGVHTETPSAEIMDEDTPDG